MTASSGSPQAVLTADVCIVGSGLAGLTVAHTLLGTGLRIAIVEGGDWERDARAQEAAEGDLDSRYYERDALTKGRRRQFGGTANDWTHVTRPGRNRNFARTLPGEAIDFETKAWAPASGWPIDLAVLTPYYEAAQQLWIGHAIDNDVASRVTDERPLLPLRTPTLGARMAQYGPNDVFVHRFRDDLIRSGLVDIHVGTTVVDLPTDRTGHEVQEALGVRSDGAPVRIRARAFVLAGGGVETVQTLLNAELGRPGAAGNAHDVVGRYVTDHPEYRMARIVPEDTGLLDRLGLYDIYHDERDGQMIGAVLTLDQDVKREERLLNVGAVLIPQPAAFGTPAEHALRVLQARESGGVGRALRTIVTSPRETAAVLAMRAQKRGDRFDYPGGHVWHRGGWSRDGFDRSPFGVLEVHAATEQTPDRENRIALSDRRDGSGRRRVAVRLHWSEEDRANLERSMAMIGAEIEASGIGRFEPWVEYRGLRRPVQTGWHHPMGGTRMHDDPTMGVVDRDCRVHGTENLFVAGSATFPTSLGYSNPTLTVVALAVRLAEHLAERLGHSGSTVRDAATAD